MRANSGTLKRTKMHGTALDHFKMNKKRHRKSSTEVISICVIFLPVKIAPHR